MLRNKRLCYLMVALLCASLLVFAGCSKETDKKAEAEKFPAKPVTIVVNSKAGSSADMMARIVAKVGEKHLGQPFVVENKPGGDGAVAMSYLLDQKADGHTVWIGAKTMVVALNTNMKQFKLEDFEPVIRVQTDILALGVRADSPFKDLKDLVAYAKANPGKVKLGGYGVQSHLTLAGYNLMEKTGTKMTWVPYNGSSEAVTNVLGGHIDVAHANVSNFKPLVDAGKMRMLAVIADKRLPDFTNVPTYKEQGADLDDSQWRGFFVKRGTPEAHIKKLHDVFKKVIEDPEYIEYLKKTNMYDGYMPTKEFKESIKKEYNDIKGGIEKVGLGK